MTRLAAIEATADKLVAELHDLHATLAARLAEDLSHPDIDPIVFVRALRPRLYHDAKEPCRHAPRSVQIPLSEARGRSLRACKICGARAVVRSYETV